MIVGGDPGLLRLDFKVFPEELSSRDEVSLSPLGVAEMVVFE